MKAVVVSFLILLLTSVTSFAQQADTSCVCANPVGRGLKDLGIQASAPFRISGNDAWWVGGGVLVTGALLATDQWVHERINPEQYAGSAGNTYQTLTKFGSTYGLGVLAVYGGYSLVSGNHKAQETTCLAGEAFIASGIWTTLIKAIAGRQRPSVAQVSGGRWVGPFGVSFSKHFSDFDSFPSGHTTTAFSIATVFASQYSDQPIVPILSYSLATTVGITRLMLNRHWTSDVFVGALIGYLSAREVMLNNPSELSRSRDNAQRVNVGWSLEYREGTPALSVQVAF